MTHENLGDIVALLRYVLFFAGAIILLLGLEPTSILEGTNTVILGLAMLVIAVVLTIADTQPPTSQMPNGKIRCPHCGMEVEVYMRPELLSFKAGEVTYVCPHCGQRI